MCPFECDWCQFWKLKASKPDLEDSADQRMMMFIRRAQLDAFWAREPGTVKGNLSGVQKVLRTQDEFNTPLLPQLRAWPTYCDHGMGPAVAILRDSLNPGRHEATVKFASVRSIRTVFTDLTAASAAGTARSMVWSGDHKRRTCSVTSPTASEWFTRFMSGLHNRLGQRTKQDAAISIEVMIALMQKFEHLFSQEDVDQNDKLKVIQSACFCLYSCCASVRGYEVPKIVLTCPREFRAPFQVGAVPPHVALPFAGHFKLRGNMDQCMLLFIAAETASGLKPLLWTDRLIESLESQGVTSGWAFCNEDGHQLRMTDLEDLIFELLEEIQSEHPELISEDVDVCDACGMARSFRRGSTTRAENAGVKADDIDYIHRWKEDKDGGTPCFQGDMRVHHGDQRQMAAKFLKFSQPL